MTTKGDQILDRPLAEIGGKGLFIKELEVAMQEGKAHLAVHSMKDVPMVMPEGFVLAAISARENPRDAFVSNKFNGLDDLPAGAVVGTSSLRRMVQLRARRPDLRIEPLRGNLDTRLRKLDEGQYDAIVLAAAGLKRLGLAERIREHIATDDMLPAAGQGALGLEIRQTHPDLGAALLTLAHQPTWLATLAERAVSRAMGGSCSMPLAAFAEWLPGTDNTPTLRLRALLGHPTAHTLVDTEIHGQPTSHTQAEALGQEVAARLKAQAGPEWLAAL
jgi:hydroxymethylbilane synthase